MKLIIKKIISYWIKKSGVNYLIKKIQNLLININIEEEKPRFSSFPFLSGDSFMMVSDLAYISSIEKPITIKNKTKPSICFLETDIFNSLQDVSLLEKYKKVIIHNGDEIPSKKLIKNLSKKKIKVFGTNILERSKYVNPIPIGIENLYLRRNGSMHFFNPINIHKISKIKSNILFASFTNNTNPSIRVPLSELLTNYGYSNNYYSIRKYREEILKSYFVISPPGNGYDCHRTWEAIYTKTIPIVLKDFWPFSEIKLPVLVVDKYESFLSLKDYEKIEIYDNLIKVNSQAAYLDWWVKLING